MLEPEQDASAPLSGRPGPGLERHRRRAHRSIDLVRRRQSDRPGTHSERRIEDGRQAPRRGHLGPADPVADDRLRAKAAPVIFVRAHFRFLVRIQTALSTHRQYKTLRVPEKAPGDTMNHDTVAAVAVVAFWTFIAVAAVTGITFDYRKKQLAVETLRFLIERGEKVDTAVIDRLLSSRFDSTPVDPRHLIVGGFVTFASGVGVVLLAFFLVRLVPIAFYPVLGAAMVVLCVGLGLIFSGRYLAKTRPPADALERLA